MYFKSDEINKISNNFSCYLIIILPAALISGPFIPDLIISICSIILIFSLKEKKYFTNYFLLFFLLSCCYFILSSMESFDINLSFESSLFYFRFGLFSIFFWYLINYKVDLLKNIFLTISLCFIVLFIDTMNQYFTGLNLLNMKIIKEDRLSSLFGDELILGSYLSRIFPIFVALYFHLYYKKKSNSQIILKIAFLLILEFTVFLSGERTAFFLLNFSILLFLIFLNGYKLEKYLILFSVGIFGFFLISVNSTFKHRIIDNSLDQMGLTDSDDTVYIFSKQHSEHYIVALDMFKENYLMGIGPKNFRVLCKAKKYQLSKNTCTTHPHNTYIQLLSETGIIGFFIGFLTLIFIWYILFKSLFYKLFKKKLLYSNFQISLLISISLSLWPLVPSGNFFNNWLSIVYYLPVGMLLWSFQNNKKIYLNLNHIFFSKS